MDVVALAKVIHNIIDGLGAGFGHLHADLDDALGTAPPAAPEPGPSDEDIAAAKAVLARAAAAEPAAG